MRRLLLAVLAALALAAPAAAQQGSLPVLTARYAAPPRAVYMATLDAMERRGIPLRARLLDRALLTLPHFDSEQPKPDDTAPVMYVEISKEGDSTQMVIQAQMVRGDGGTPDSSDEMLARVLVVEVSISSAVDTAMDALAKGAGGPDPREDSDEYGYGRRNPIRVGGAEATAASQHRYLATLRGPAGQPVRYRRLGSCCNFQTPNAPKGGAGALDAYEVTYDGLERPVILYMDLYTAPEGSPPPPEGFTFATSAAPAASP